MSKKNRLPSYEPMLAAYHRALAVELRRMVAVLPIDLGQSVLDMACGDGVYSPWLAERVGSGGRVMAVDRRSEYLELARTHSASSPFSAIIEFLAASIESLPLDDRSFDFCWCAQSLYSLPDPVQALRHMLRVTKPGGVVAVLEGDSLHHILLPWPVELELSVRAAELESLCANRVASASTMSAGSSAAFFERPVLKKSKRTPSQPIERHHLPRTIGHFSPNTWRG